MQSNMTKTGILLNRNERLLVDGVIETAKQVVCLPDDITEGQGEV